MERVEHLVSESEHGVASDISQFLNFIYELMQSIVIWLFSPPSESKLRTQRNRLRIAVIGAGLTGVSAAAHCRGHGADVAIFEANSRDHLGGIWSQVNSSSSLQLYSVMYRFHPTVRWHRRYPHKGRILEEIRKLWHRYGLEGYTYFNTPVSSVKSRDGKWIINDDSTRFGTFDGVIPAIGTCGDPKMPQFPNESSFQGTICHSSQMDSVDISDKKVAIVGGGASAIEVVENAVANGASQVDIVARSHKWIIPRNIIVDTILSLNIFGEETILSFIPEYALRWFFYRGLKDLAPQTKGFYTGTPMCNDQILDQIRAGKCRWITSDIISLNENGVLVNQRAPRVPKGGPGKKIEVSADVIVKATGFHRPNMHFLPAEVFEEPFGPPAWYLQVFPTQHPEVCAINSVYVNALGTVGHIHIGIYARLLMAFLLQPSIRPTTQQMQRWVRWVAWFKDKTPQYAFDYFTYSELLLWLISCVVFNPRMWPWGWFVLTGLGTQGRTSAMTNMERKMNHL